MVAKILDVHPGRDAAVIFGALTRNPMTRRLEMQMARQMREELRNGLIEAVQISRRDGSMPFRTGRGYARLLRGGRAFGTTFASLRGHIVSPPYMVAHEKGTMIEPVQAAALAIPLPAALRQDGTPKLPGPRSWTLHGSFLYKSRKTGGMFIARKDANDKLILLYVLVDAAQLKQHKGFMSKAWEKEEPLLLQRWGQLFARTIEAVDTDEFVAAGERGGTGRRR